MNGKETEVFTFDKFRVDVANGVLFRDGELVALQWKTFETLLVLVRSEGRLISRNELIETVWPDAFVEENNLSQHIRSLRKALGDGENEKKFIETVPRRGFRFLPEVKRVEETDKIALVENTDLAVTEVPGNIDIAVENTAMAIPIRQRRSRWPIIAAAVAILAAGIGGLAYWLTRPTPTERRLEYANQIRLAGQALEASNLTLLKEQLDLTTPKKGEEDLRGFEWGYLAHQFAERTASQPMVLEHDGWGDEVAFSKDGKLLAVASTDARIWEVSTGKLVLTINGHSKSVASVAFSPDGTKLVTGSSDLSAKLWDISTRQELWRIDDPSNQISMGRLCFSLDGKVLYTESAKRKIRSWDASTGEEILDQRSLHGLRHPFAWSPDGKYIAGQPQEDWAIEVKEISTGRTVATLKRDIGFVTDVTFAPDSRSALVKGSENIAYLWELPSGKQIKKFDGVTCAPSFSPDGKSIAMCSKDAIKLWDIENKIETSVLRGHTDNVKWIAFSPYGQRLASSGAGGDHTVRIWNVPNETRGVLRGHKDKVRSVAFSPDSKLLASASVDKTARIWDVASERSTLTLIGHTDEVNSVDFSPAGPTIATGSHDKMVKIWDTITGRQVDSFDSLVSVANAAYSPNGKVIVTSHWWDDPNVRLWNAATGNFICSFPSKDVGLVKFTKDGSQMAVSLGDGVKLWNTSNCAEARSFDVDPSIDYFSLFTPDDKLISIQSLNNDRSMKIIDPASGAEIANISGSGERIMWVVLSPDGKRMIIGDETGLIRICDLATGQELLSIKANDGSIEQFAISPDGNTLAVPGPDGVVQLFRSVDFR